ncbi:type IV pilin protein [Thalassotalea psychrophila]|uniref:Type IV pilin protein n=1 Tax=Thalassotalea psychrophila TaxID=3065647 RepID=A0ABY9TXR1_9GAMM|nr:type IV pilin protein [Colwelliaceae bacterium SQ149]
MKSYCKQGLGFTLLELMITLAIIGILTSIAHASFKSYVLKARRIDATETLMKLAIAQEKFYNQHMHYSTDISSATGLNHQSSLSSEGFYQLSVEIKTYVDDGQDSFVLTAKAINSQAKDEDCMSFALNNLTERKAMNNQGVENNACW